MAVDVAHGGAAELRSGQQNEGQVALGSAVSLAHVDVQQSHFFVMVQNGVQQGAAIHAFPRVSRAADERNAHAGARDESEARNE